MEKYELDAFHDSIYNSIKKSLSDDELLDLIKKLPEDILSIGVQWVSMIQNLVTKYMNGQKHK